MINFLTRTMTAVTMLLILMSCLVAGLLAAARHQQLQVLSVQTGSMRPAIRAADAVLVRRNITDLSVGDVIAYRSSQNQAITITHRIIEIDRNRGVIITRGDALQTDDPAIGFDRIIGKVERTVPYLGYALDMFRHPAGLLLAVYVPAAILSYGEVRRLLRYYALRRYRLYAYPW